jgi:copper chaperone CopZ
MKRIPFILTAVLLSFSTILNAQPASQNSATSQIKSVTLQASGLTCSMCSRAIYKSLQKVSDVSKVEEDIEHTSYHIWFSDPSGVSLDNLKKAVVDAGFSVASMKVNADFKNVPIASDSSLQINDLIFRFVDIRTQHLNGEKTLLILDKDYLQDKDRKKYNGLFESIPVTGGGERIFHVTLRQS